MKITLFSLEKIADCDVMLTDYDIMLCVSYILKI